MKLQRRTRIRLMAPKVPQTKTSFKDKLKRPKSINLKRILEKTPESMQMLIKLNEITEVVKSAKEVAQSRPEEAAVEQDVAIRIRTWYTELRT